MNAIAIAAELDGEATLPAKQLAIVMEIAGILEDALREIAATTDGVLAQKTAVAALRAADRRVEGMR